MKPVPTWFRIASWAMAVLLATCVALQYNDPDPVRWMAIYGAGALLSLVLPARRPAALAGLIVGAVCAAWAISLVYATWGVIGLSDLTGKMSEKGGAVEAGREAGGLAIEGAWLVLGSWFRLRRA